VDVSSSDAMLDLLLNDEQNRRYMNCDATYAA
jgi:hypothetical protein